MAIGAWLTLASLGAQAVGPADAAQAPSATPRLQTAIVRAAGLPFEGLAAALSERLPGLAVVASAPDRFQQAAGTPFVYVEVTGKAAEGGTLTITAILPDGRAFVREFAPDPADAVRSTAALIANLVGAIEQETLVPSRLDAPLPAHADDVAPLPPKPEPEPEPEPEPAPPPAAVPRPADQPAPARTPEPRFDPALGVALFVDAVLGLRKPQASGAGEAALMVRLRQGLLASVQLRYTARQHSDTGLHRIRVAALVGYAWRVRRFQLLATAGALIEPWWLTDRSGRIDLGPGAPRGGPLLGGLAALAPSLHINRRRPAFDLGARATFSLSALPSGSDVRVVRPSDGTLFALGGPEWSVGLWAAVWLPLRRDGSRDPPARSARGAR